VFLQPEQKLIEKLKLKLRYTVEIYSFSRTADDSDIQIRIYSSASIVENPMLCARRWVGQALKKAISGCLKNTICFVKGHSK
jgi:hypothetical protein